MLEKIDDVRRIREIVGLTQIELAEKAGISQSTIAKIEAGSYMPSFHIGKEILKILEIELTKKTLDKTAGNIHNISLFYLEPDDTVEDAIDMMKSEAVSQLPVIKDDKAVGAVTERGLLNKYDNLDKKRKIESVMDPPFPIVDESVPSDMLHCMLKYSPCVLTSNNGKIVGIVTKADILDSI